MYFKEYRVLLLTRFRLSGLFPLACTALLPDSHRELSLLGHSPSFCAWWHHGDGFWVHKQAPLALLANIKAALMCLKSFHTLHPLDCPDVSAA